MFQKISYSEHNSVSYSINRQYERESVNTSQIDIKTRDIRTCTKHLFLDISSTNIDTSVPSLYQRVKTCSLPEYSVSSRKIIVVKSGFHVTKRHTFVIKCTGRNSEGKEDRGKGGHLPFRPGEFEPYNSSRTVLDSVLRGTGIQLSSIPVCLRANLTAQGPIPK
jgi:hypothetical protein